MKKTIYLFIGIITFFSNHLKAQHNSSFETTPSWVENFQGECWPDSNKWNISNFFSDQHLAYYLKSKQNVSLKRGKLCLTIRKDSIKKYNYTSGRIVSKCTFLFGKIEFRVKCPTTKGVWNAIWLKDNQATGCFGEFDILEHIGCWSKRKIQINPHLWGTFDGKEKNHKQYPYSVNIDISKYHIYTLEWYRDCLLVLVDGKKVYQLIRSDIEEWPFAKPYSLVIALAYGGNWAGACGLADNKLPQTMKIDWIKYYHLVE